MNNTWRYFDSDPSTLDTTRWWIDVGSIFDPIYWSWLICVNKTQKKLNINFKQSSNRLAISWNWTGKINEQRVNRGNSKHIWLGMCNNEFGNCEVRPWLVDASVSNLLITKVRPMSSQCATSGITYIQLDGLFWIFNLCSLRITEFRRFLNNNVMVMNGTQ